MQNNFIFPDYVTNALRRLEENGFSAYVVGGAVRDIYMNKLPCDFDLTTDALPDDTLRIFSDLTTVETGRRFGTITVVSGGNALEITTFRSDGTYLNSRSPEAVFFSKTLSEDLKRRDFTINALAYSDTAGIVDLFGGKQDIDDKIIRCIGNADERFSEDALRILRAIRFSSVLGFELEQNTQKSIFKNKALLLNISAERISSELNKILLGQNVKSVLIKFREVIGEFIPEIKVSDSSSYTSAAETLCKSCKDKAMRLSIFLNELAPETASKALRRLKYDSKTVKTVKTLIEYKKAEIIPKKPKIKLLLNKIGVENAKKLFYLKELSEPQNPNIKKARELLNTIISGRECFSLKELKINGSDLTALGFSGSHIGNALKYALEEVIHERCENEKECLSKCILSKYRR